jgi:hypothetical protein
MFHLHRCLFNEGYNTDSRFLAVIFLIFYLKGRFGRGVPMLMLTALIPVISLVFLNAATGVLLTTPLRHRLCGLPAILIPATVSFRTIQYLSFVPGPSELWGSITLIGLIHFSSLLYIKKWTLRTTQQAGKVSKITDNWIDRKLWTHMYKVATNPRLIRVPSQDVILVEQRTRLQVKSTALHRKFSVTRILWLLVKIGILFLLNRLVTTRLLGIISIGDFIPAKAVLLRRLLRLSIYQPTGPISMREIVMRIWFTMNTIWTPIILLDSIHTALAIFFIHVLHIDIPEDWPDLFGSCLEAFTFGRFWTSYVHIRSYFIMIANEIRRFWHRCHLSGYSDYANLLISMLPRWILRNAAIKRVFKTFSLFLISGMVHHLTSWQLNLGCRDHADLQFFCVNGAAVTLESALLQRIFPSQTSEDDKRHRAGRSHTQRLLRVALVRFVGYTWVMSFLVWAIPKFYYPRVYCTVNQQLQVREMMV